MTERDPAYGGDPSYESTYAHAPYGIVAAFIVGAVLLGAILTWSLSRPAEQHRQFPESVTKVDRSCYRNFCAQALPGHLVRVTTRDGTVVGVRYGR